MRWLAAGVAVGCAHEEVTRAPLAVELRSEEPPGWVTGLRVRVQQVVVRGFGPDGPESVATEVGQVFDLLAADPGEPVAVSLAEGGWSDVVLAVWFAADAGDDALALVGRGERGPVSFAVTRFEVEGDEGDFELGVGGATAQVELRPGEWDELEELEGRVDAAHPDYAERVEEVVDTTRVVLPGDDD